MVVIIVDKTRPRDILHQKGTIRFQSLVYSQQYFIPPGLIMNCIERGYQIESAVVIFFINWSGRVAQKTHCAGLAVLPLAVHCRAPPRTSHIP